MDIIKLVKKSKKGSKTAFSILIKNYEVDLYRVAISITKNEDDALDCIQETILQAYINIPNLNKNEYFKTWLIKILINQCNALIKKNKKYILTQETIKSKNSELENTYTQENQVIDIKESIDILEEELRILVILYYYQDMSVKDISESIEIPEGTVKSRLSRARNKLKEMLSMEGEL